MKALIIDDEQKARNLLQTLIQENCKNITEIYQADNLLSGVELIKSEQPQLVFLDIEMPGNSGLEILDFIDKEDYHFEIIFTTAYSEYAIQAIQLSAIDYLLKPISGSKVKTAVERALTFLGKSKINQRLDELKQVFKSQTLKKIGLPVNDGIEFVAFEDIIMLEADGMYTKVFTTDGEMLISKPLKHFVELLQNVKVFYRPHRSYLVNLMFIKKYVKSDGGYILMDNDRSVSISKDRTDEFMQLMQNI
ncbi:two component transcriptional regulator, LytTR family [Reichenbachiella agariperforans]|uniref:Two component transcriptional regulator, LytTR family n=1 Tax=Reichenbachiella agariperforans TaxID=156994 RepID=A0A1M6NS34_REIAG|nr:LytTR family DNA-binding domain-containing protein [Reichenbachiella agariperforans]SHJ98484.1 two component transcriptional regulator, LytTR family [Reichenbachiella agariperforans]